MLRVIRTIGIILEDIVGVFEACKIMWEMYQKKAEEMRKMMRDPNLSRKDINYLIRLSLSRNLSATTK